jgi:hypothetical protein
MLLTFYQWNDGGNVTFAFPAESVDLSELLKAAIIVLCRGTSWRLNDRGTLKSLEHTSVAYDRIRDVAKCHAICTPCTV